MSENGKLIYQLTSASALKDTDLFVISSADRLTRSITLSQLREAINGDRYSNDKITELLDELKLQIKNITDSLSEYDNNLSEFRNEFNTQLQSLRTSYISDLNNTKSEINTRITILENDMFEEFESVKDIISELTKNTNNKFTEYNNNLTSVNTSLQQRITELDTRLTELIDGLILYGPSIPTSLSTGKVYLQYF